MRAALVGVVLLLAGLVAVALGVLPVADALALAERVWPVLTFVVAVTVVTQLAAAAGLFRVVAVRLARLSGGRGLVVWLVVVALAIVSTVFLSLDTTAVLLTPVVVAIAVKARLDPAPLALTTVWLANTASLLLPVSNLTNLLAEHLVPGGPAEFVGLTLAPAVVAIVVPVLAVLIVHRRTILVTASEPEPEPIEDRPLLVVSGVLVAALLPALVSGVAVWIPASLAALALVAATALRRPSRLAGARALADLVPWQPVVFAAGLFLAVAAAQRVGLAPVLAAVAGNGTDAVALLRVSATGGVLANLVDNLPAYLALEPAAASHPVRLVALLIGVNAGPLITPWASLATLLWHRQASAAGVHVPWRRYVLLGSIVAPVTVAAATAALALAVT